MKIEKQSANARIMELIVLPAVLIILFILPHVLFLNNGYVDLERNTVQAARDIAANGFNANLTSYFEQIANPIFSVLLLAGGYKIFGESPVISRLTVMIPVLIFSLLLYFYLRDKKGASFAFPVSLFMVVNPMFIIYSQYVYSDITFMVFLSASLVLLLYNSSLKESIPSSILLGISLATKYIAAPFFVVALLFNGFKSEIIKRFSRSRLLSFIGFNTWYFVLAIAVSLPVILQVLHYQASPVSSQYESVITLSFGMYVPRLFSYLLWLGLFIGPFCIIAIYDLWKKAGPRRFLILAGGLVVLTAVISIFYPISSLHIQASGFGEMNLGWVESKVPSPLLSVIFFVVILVAELFIASMIYDWKRGSVDKIKRLCLWVILPLVIFSLTRVANRYMLALLVPLSIYMASVAYFLYTQNKNRLVPVLLTLHAVIFLAVGFYSNYYLHGRGLG